MRPFAGYAGLPLLLLLVLPASAPAQPGGLAQVVWYTSSLDDSQQAYGIYVPAAPAPSPDGYPAVFHAHGYGWSVSAGFSDFQKQWAERHGWMLINLNARGPQFYEGVGDVESRNVVRDANRRFGLDLSRLYITGGSMGGTGAFRLAVRHPDLFAAAVGVDGWSDYHEWHHHWYARADQRDEIEEFRRPLLEACSPLYSTGRARWGNLQASVSGRDDVVLPQNGLDLYNALLQRADNMPGAYSSRLFLDYEAGHGGSTRMDQIYEYFAYMAGLKQPESFLCESSILTYGDMYWGSMKRLRLQGAFAALESDVQGNIVSVMTRNLSEMALHLQASPVAALEKVVVYADGFRCYEGPPSTVELRADWSPQGQLWGWQVREPEGLRKTPQLEGPIGEAFKVPFMVVYGTAGDPGEVARNRREAEDFARGWNDFMVHGKGVQAIPEELVSAPDLQGKSLVLFGTENSSSLLREVAARCDLPVRVRSDRLLVRDPEWGDREYRGAKYGAFFCYPNPLSEYRTYLVVCRGQWATKPDATGWQGLEYDLEKLPWAYPDYFVINSDQSELPHVLNVNNKPPVTCYEAGYIAEAGYFDQDWQPYRSATLDRVRTLKLPTRRLAVEEIRYDDDGQVRVRVVDEANAPAKQARVTVQFEQQPTLTVSGVTDDDGVACFTAPQEAAPACSIVNVEATGAVYDWAADFVNSTAEKGLRLRAQATPAPDDGVWQIVIDAGAEQPTMARVTVSVPAGALAQPVRELRLDPGAPARLSFLWNTSGLPVGTYTAQVTMRSLGQPLQSVRVVPVEVTRGPESPLRMVESKATDFSAGGGYEITTRLLNLSSSACTATVRCSLLEARRYLPSQEVVVAPQQEVAVVFKPVAGEASLAAGTHTARIAVEGHRGVTTTVEFTVK